MELELVVDEVELRVGGVLQPDPEERVRVVTAAQLLERVAEVAAREPLALAVDGLVHDHGATSPRRRRSREASTLRRRVRTCPPSCWSATATPAPTATVSSRAGCPAYTSPTGGASRRPARRAVPRPARRAGGEQPARALSRDRGAARRGRSASRSPSTTTCRSARYGAWTGRALKDLAKEPLWRTVQDDPEAARFPDDDRYAAESLQEMSDRVVARRATARRRGGGGARGRPRSGWR